MPKYVNDKKLQKELFKRTEGYAAEVRNIYLDALGKIIELVKGTELEDGKPFSFSEYGYSEDVTPILRNMYSQTYQTIRNSVQKEWLLSNENNDGLVKSMFGEQSIEDNHFARFFLRNMEAMDAFFARKTKDGLNLSQKVWKYTGMYKEELEKTLDLAIGEGIPANRLATKIKEYLNDPDRWYRRFRMKTGEDEDGNPIYGRKWKRRVYDQATGTYKWVDDNPKKYHPGKGIYRSSYRNAQRLARTETNIAYRTADYTRWAQLDFVVGIEIKLSNNHPVHDICDDLKGKYPKTFKWTGWHPNCRCYQVPILAKDEEIDEMLDHILDGENTETVQCDDEVQSMPPQFNSWMSRNEKRIEDASQNGTLPYFLRDNWNEINKKSAKQIAQKRHDARTPDQEDSIRKAWWERKATYHYGNNILNIMSGISDIDTSALEEALRHPDLASIMTEARKLKKAGKEIYGLESIENPMDVAKQFSMAEAKAANKAVSEKLKQWEKSSLESQEHAIQFEIDWVKNHKKYPTWEVAANSYEKALAKVKSEIRKQRIDSDIKAVEAFTKTNNLAGIKSLFSQLKSAYDQGDIESAERFLKEAQRVIEDYKAELLKQGLNSTTSLEKYCDQHRTFRSNVTNQEKFEKFQEWMMKDTGTAWKSAKDEARQCVQGYTDGTYDEINRSYWKYKKTDKRGEMIDSILDNIATSKDLVLRRGCNMSEMQSIFGNEFYKLMQNGDIDGLNALKGCRGVNEGFISTSFDMQGGFWKEVDLRIYAPKGTHALYAKPISGYGDGLGSGWDGKNAKKDFLRGRENEVIVHRGYEYRFIKAETGGKNRSKITIFIELLSREKRIVK